MSTLYSSRDFLARQTNFIDIALLKKKFSALDILGSTKLFSSSSKTEKKLTAELGYHIGIQYMIPAKISSDLLAMVENWVSVNPQQAHLLDLMEMDNRNICAFKGLCEIPCLQTSGRLKFTKSQLAMLKRRLLFTYAIKYEPAIYFDLLCQAIDKEQRKAHRLGLKLAVRLNGTSDIRFERLNMKTGKEDAPISGESIIRKYPNVEFYDYTKFPNFLRISWMPWENYHLTYSFNENTTSLEIESNFKAGRNVAIVFRSHIPNEIMFDGNLVEVIDGDKHDLRLPHIDGTSKFIALTAKGEGKTDYSGFINDYDPTSKTIRKYGNFYNLDSKLEGRN
jgi:hypothetical protein